MHVGEVCSRSVATCRRETSALDLARLMRERGVAEVVVVDSVEGGVTPVGIVTDRDLVVEVMAAGIDPNMLRVDQMIVAEPVSVLDAEWMSDAVWHMRGKGIHRLPVVDARNRLIGLLTADDITRWLAQELTEITRIRSRSA